MPLLLSFKNERTTKKKNLTEKYFWLQCQKKTRLEKWHLVHIWVKNLVTFFRTLITKEVFFCFVLETKDKIDWFAVLGLHLPYEKHSLGIWTVVVQSIRPIGKITYVRWEKKFTLGVRWIIDYTGKKQFFPLIENHTIPWILLQKFKLIMIFKFQCESWNYFWKIKS